MNNKGDFNQDGFVDFTDLQILVANWNKNYINKNGVLFQVNFATLSNFVSNWNKPVQIIDDNFDFENNNVVSNFIQNSGLNPGDEFHIMMSTTDTINLNNNDGSRNNNVDSSLFWNQFAQSSYNNNGSILGDITVKAFVATSQSNVPSNINYLSLVELEGEERNNIPTFNLRGDLIFQNADDMWNINNHHGENIGYNDSNEHLGYNQDLLFWTGMDKNGEKHSGNPLAYTFEGYLLPENNPLRVQQVMCGWPWTNDRRHNFEFTSRPGDESRHIYSFTQKLRIGDDGETIEQAPIECPCISLIVNIDNNHNHNLEIPCQDLILQREKTYTLVNGGHNHNITLTPEDFSNILENGFILKNSSVNFNHNHQIKITCLNQEPIIWELVINNNNVKSYVIIGNEEIDLDIELSALYLTKTSGIMLAGLSNAGENNVLSNKTIYSTDNGLTWRVCGDGEGNGILPLGVTEFMQGYGNYNWAVFAAAENGVFHSTDEGVHWKKFHFNVEQNNQIVADENTSILSLGMDNDGNYLLLSSRDSGIIYKFNINELGIYSDVNNPITGNIVFNRNGLVSQFVTNKVNGITYFVCDQNHENIEPHQQNGGIYSFIDQEMNQIERLPVGNNGETLKISNAKRIIVTEDFNCDIYVGLLERVGKYSTNDSSWNNEFISSPNFPNNYYINRFISNETNPPYISNSEYPYWINDIYNNINNSSIKLQPNLPSPESFQPNQMIFGKDGRIYLSLSQNNEGNILYRSVNAMNNSLLPNYVLNFN